MVFGANLAQNRYGKEFNDTKTCRIVFAISQIIIGLMTLTCLTEFLIPFSIQCMRQ